VPFARLADSMGMPVPPNGLAGACTVHLMKLPRPKPKVVLLGSGTCRCSLQQNVNIRLRPACRRYNFPALLPRSVAQSNYRGGKSNPFGASCPPL